MREHHLLVPPNLRQEAKPTPQGGKRKPSKRNQWWGIDMTKRLVAGRGLGLYRHRARWVYKGGREPLGWPAMHGHAMAGRAGHGGQPFVAT